VRAFPILLTAALVLTGCDRDAPADGLAAPRRADGIAGDPLLRSVVFDPIMSDLQLASRSNIDAIRPPPQPLAMPIPAREAAAPPPPEPAGLPALPAPGPCAECDAARNSITPGALIERMPGFGGGVCAATIGYSAMWAARLPDVATLDTDAHVVEAAGSERCGVRAVAFWTGSSPSAVLARAASRAELRGLRTERRSDGVRHVLRAIGKAGASSLVMIVTARDDGGSDARLIVRTS
jgi:hypothetical protein